MYTRALASQSRTVVEMGSILASMKYALFMYTVYCVCACTDTTVHQQCIYCQISLHRACALALLLQTVALLKGNYVQSRNTSIPT